MPNKDGACNPIQKGARRQNLHDKQDNVGNSKNKPDIVDSNVNNIAEPIEVKNGCYAKVSFNLYYYNSHLFSAPIPSRSWLAW